MIAPYYGLGLRRRPPVSARTPAPDVGERFARMRDNGDTLVRAPFTGPTFTVVKQKLLVTIVERGTLESAENSDPTCATARMVNVPTITIGPPTPTCTACCALSPALRQKSPKFIAMR